MFEVQADSLESYFEFDPRRRSELEKVDSLIRRAAPGLGRYFHRGTPAGQAGMRLKMIGYGQFRYAVTSGKQVLWPVIGLALQKNYISLYFAVTFQGRPVTALYTGRLGALRAGRNNFSFERFSDLDADALETLVTRSAEIFEAEPDNPVRYKQSS
ncbi:MAG: DUF1801 domain-containing protein [Aquamicrobium sp.]|uniref:DUF1801 domain-containing protein n=1 Tax=Mesorhizobium sp. Pch-S TaxID=2082387 RepID=UPI0013EACC6B|nr:DUF1801 domain-containing protein [Mesorhizobium sp. Pch-S]MBR2691714.1 DUF1801 domain-containing protein [Aquamicrobium sp.]